jgi:hypothetical protein
MIYLYLIDNRNSEDIDEFVCMKMNKRELQELVDFINLYLECNQDE